MNEWSARDQGLAVGLVMYESDIHAGCGQPASESMDPDGPDYTADNIKCRACALLKDQGSENDEPGTVWYVTKR